MSHEVQLVHEFLVGEYSDAPELAPCCKTCSAPYPMGSILTGDRAHVFSRIVAQHLSSHPSGYTMESHLPMSPLPFVATCTLSCCPRLGLGSLCLCRISETTLPPPVGVLARERVSFGGPAWLAKIHIAQYIPHEQPLMPSLRVLPTQSCLFGELA